ncbi:hypothetical protein [Aquimarina sp. 2201CG14-23]|uniref:hypothetical protein n=1 Tax=Aquimarina mycalae TaxID=3040073 RepID=UPI002477DA9F|nr:hypothetical protein [Aquimarina sp. 2201CG14-23]MDH7445314.1 hypothetical protein [Aquimarina sp. 2201CG14-23]
MQFALLISVIIAILLSAFLLLTHVQSFFRIKSQELIKASELASLALVESLENNSITKDTIRTNIDTKTLKLVSNYHGIWTKTITEAVVKNRKIKQAAFSGTAIHSKTANLYLANKNSPLVVVGNTRLEGNSYLPKQGIKAGNISGNYYQGSSLYYGRTVESKPNIPELDTSWISYIESLLKGAYLDEDHIIPLSIEIKNSFYDPTKTIYSNETITLGNENIAGNIIIQSTSKIVITAASRLTDVVLIAPTIIVQDNVKGRFQLIATKKIEVGTQCHLYYPSSVTLLDKTATSSTNQGNAIQQRIPNLIIEKNTTIEGVLLYLKKKQEVQNRIKTHLKVETGAQIIGEIYCQGNAEFLGTVKGSLFTHQFIANQSGSVYLNHLYNGKILVNPIPDYAGLPFKNSKKNVATWLY